MYDAYEGDLFTTGWTYIGITYSAITWPTVSEENRDWYNDHGLKYESKVLVYMNGPGGYERYQSVIFDDYYDETKSYPYKFDTKFGTGLVGFIRSAYIWTYAKAFNNLYMTGKRNHRHLDQCLTFGGQPYVSCQMCDQINGLSTCFSSCQTNTYSLDWSSCPEKICTNNLCETCYEDTSVKDDNRCTGCVRNAFYISEEMGDCQCKKSSYYQPSTESCELCHPWCVSCFGSSNTQCNSCVDGKYYIGENTCVADCTLLGDLYVYDARTDSCRECPEHTYTFDGVNCVDQGRPTELTNYNNEFLILEFDQPVAYRYTSANAIFSILVEGTRPKYDVKFSVPYWPKNQYEKEVMIELEWFSSLNGDEQLILFINPAFIYNTDDYVIITTNNTAQVDYAPLTVDLDPFEYISLEAREGIEQTGFFFLIVLLLILIFCLFLVAISDGTLELFWVFLNTLQIIDFIPLLNLSFPTTLFLTFKYLHFTNFHIPIWQEYFRYFFDLDHSKFLFDRPWTENFEEYGLDSLRLIMNSSSALALCYQIIVISAVILVTRVLFMNVFACSDFWKKFETHMRWNGFLRLALVLFLGLFLSSLLNFYAVGEPRFAENLSWTITYLVLFITILGIPLLIYRLKKYRSSFDSQYMLERYSTVYSEFKDDHFYEYMHTVVFLVRRILYCVILVHGYADPLGQLIMF